VSSTKLVDGRACGYTYDGQRDRTHIADCSSVDCNALTRVHRFVVQVVPTVVRQLSRFLLRQRVARSVCGSRASCFSCVSTNHCSASQIIATVASCTTSFGRRSVDYGNCISAKNDSSSYNRPTPQRLVYTGNGLSIKHNHWRHCYHRPRAHNSC